MTDPIKVKRGLGSPNYSPEKAQAARRSGMAALRSAGKAHHWTSDEAIEAGRKGGAARAAQRRAVAA